MKRDDPETAQLLRSAFDAYVAGDRARGDQVMATLRAQLSWPDRVCLRIALTLCRWLLVWQVRRRGGAA